MKHIGFKSCIVLLFAALTTISCKKEDQRAIDQELIEAFILEQDLDAQSTESGLHYVVFEPGSSDHPTLNDEVTMSYVGFLLDGKIFDFSGVDDITHPLSGFIQGWQEGIPLFGKGGKGLLIIPSHLAYGNTVKSGIPPNSVLVFEIHLKSF